MRRPGRKTSCYIATALTRASVRPPSLIVTRTATADEKDEAAAGHAQEKNLNMSRIVCHTPTNQPPSKGNRINKSSSSKRETTKLQSNKYIIKKETQHSISPDPSFSQTRFFSSDGAPARHMLEFLALRFASRRFDYQELLGRNDVRDANRAHYLIFFFFSSSY